MICEGCYYKYEGNVYFVAEPICSNGMSRVFKCEQIDDASAGYPLYITWKDRE